jgi:hypothetical protein
MLVISSDLVLVDVSTQFSLNNPIIGYDNIVTAANISASSADASGFYPATNMANPATYALWKASSTAAQAIIINNSGDDYIEFVGIARHNLGTIKATVRIQGSQDGGSTYQDLTSDQLFANDDPIIFRFTKLTYDAIKIVIGAATGSPAKIAVVSVGPLLTLQRRIYVGHTPITYARQTNNVNGMSESGQFLGRLFVAEGRATSVQLKNLTPDWYRTYFDPFCIAAETLPFFFAWRPADYPNEVGYCWLASDPKPVNQGSNGLMSVDMNVGGIA